MITGVRNVSQYILLGKNMTLSMLLANYSTSFAIFSENLKNIRLIYECRTIRAAIPCLYVHWQDFL